MIVHEPVIDTAPTDTPDTDTEHQTNTSATRFIFRTVEGTKVIANRTLSFINSKEFRYALRVAIMVCIIVVAVQVAVLMHGVVLSLNTAVNTVCLVWYTMALINLTYSAITGISARARRRPRTLGLRVDTSWLSVESAQRVWAWSAVVA